MSTVIRVDEDFRGDRHLWRFSWGRICHPERWRETTKEESMRVYAWWDEDLG